MASISSSSSPPHFVPQEPVAGNSEAGMAQGVPSSTASHRSTTPPQSAHPMYARLRRADSHSSLRNYLANSQESKRSSDGGGNWTYALLESAFAQLSKDKLDEDHCKTALMTLYEEAGNLDVLQLLRVRSALHTFMANPRLAPLSKLKEKASEELAYFESIPVNINEPDSEGLTALHIAVLEGKSDMAVLALEAGADVNRGRSGDGSAPLHLAALSGDAIAAKLLLEYGATVDLPRISDSTTPLQLAVEAGHEAVVKLLLEHNADKNQAWIHDGCAPLHIAAQKGHEAVVKLLLDVGADVDPLTNEDSTTPLILAAEKGHEAVVKLLLAAGADVNAVRADDDCTALHLAAQCGSERTVTRLLVAGAEVNVRMSDDGITPLHSVSTNGSERVARLLLAAGAEVDPLTTDNASTPLHVAVEHGHTAVVKVLLKAGAQVHRATADDRCTPLFTGAELDHIGIVNMLLNKAREVYGVTTEKWKDFINAKNSDGITPLQAAVLADSLCAVSILRIAGPDIVEFPDLRTEQIALLDLVTTKCAADTALIAQPMIKMRLMDQDGTLDARVQQALDDKEWDLIAALLPIMEESRISERSSEMLEAAFTPEPEGGSTRPGLTAKLRRALAQTIGLMYVDSLRNKANGEPYLALPASDASKYADKRRLFHDAAALRVAFAADPTIDTRDPNLKELAEFVDSLEALSRNDKLEVLACIGKVDSSGIEIARSLLPYVYQDGDLRTADFHRWSFAARRIMSRLDNRLPNVSVG